MRRIIVGISGATGCILAYKVIETLIKMDIFVELVMSRAACQTAQHELGEGFSSPQLFKKQFSHELQEKIVVHSIHDVGATIASGSYQTDGMIIVPCSVASVAALSVGLGDNLLRRAFDVTLKENRPMVLAVREMPLSAIHLENLLKLSRLGVQIIPPMPAWYHKPKSLQEVEDHIVGKLIRSLGISNALEKTWKGKS